MSSQSQIHPGSWRAVRALQLVLALMGSVLASCSTEPVPLVYGTDACHFCKMTLMDKKFGAELVTQKGKVYKFDDLRCLLSFYHADSEPTDQYLHLMVVDYSDPGKLISGKDAYYVKSASIRSPMDGQLAAFESKSTMDSYKKQWNGIYMTWGEVVTQFK